MKIIISTVIYVLTYIILWLVPQILLNGLEPITIAHKIAYCIYIIYSILIAIHISLKLANWFDKIIK
jgi:hypothetical protein